MMPNMNKKVSILVVIVLTLLIGIVWNYNSEKNITSEISKVKIASLPNVLGLPVYIAIEKGYFTDEGLDVELIKFEAPNQIIDALLQGQVDISHPGAATGIAGIADFKNSGKIKIYALSGEDDSKVQYDAILVKKDSDIKTIQDLKGKKLGIMAGTIQWQTIAREILDQNNLVYDKDVKIVEIALGLQAQALATGDIDASLIVEPVPTVVKAKGIGQELVPFVAAKYISNPFYAGAGIIRVDFAKENPNTTKKLINAINKAIKDIRENPDENRQYLKGYTQLDDTTIANAPIVLFKMYNEFDDKDINETQKFYDIFTKWGVVDGKMDFKQLIYSPVN
jgi:NitT/TauT family transport system substrate-binding protein